MNGVGSGHGALGFYSPVPPKASGRGGDDPLANGGYLLKTAIRYNLEERRESVELCRKQAKSMKERSTGVLVLHETVPVHKLHTRENLRNRSEAIRSMRGFLPVHMPKPEKIIRGNQVTAWVTTLVRHDTSTFSDLIL
ncbi:hypothetical protein Ddye_009837 [Dipteronia dyeriana]|uniref:Uncharacterized protein n=1 Tax=Dipteronia dyeriana TaxID=168575 RepID=A0AAE0CMK4_9ROSI|nr:hypothetical protein Ddye_009837 [Dipteronia dyeriana]